MKVNQLKSLSIVIPCFNEEEAIVNSYNELKPILDALRNIKCYQIVFVNNGSTDSTLKKILEISEKDTCIKTIDLRNNFGYQSSISAGLFNADHEMIISIDADLQDDPNKIGEMIDLHYQGYDMVLGIRSDRKTDNVFKRFFSELFYSLSNLMGMKTVFNHGDFRLLTRELVESIKSFPEKNRYLRGMILLLDNQYGKVYYSRRKRKFGKTKFNVFNLLGLALDGITSFTVTPIRFIFFLGVCLFLLSIILGIYTLYIFLFNGIEIQGWTSLFILILFFGGIQNISIGIIGEYVSKTYIETKNRPLYFIRKIYQK